MSDMSERLHSAYLHTALDPDSARTVVSTAVQIIAEWSFSGGLPKFDTIVFRGMSGALIAPRVADRLDKRLLLIRKAGDDTHSGYTIEGGIPDKYLILDDVSFSGTTIRTIAETLEKSMVFRDARCVGLLMYNQFDKQSFVNLTPTQQKIPMQTFMVNNHTGRLKYKNGVCVVPTVEVKPTPHTWSGPMSWMPILFKRTTH